MMQYKYHCEKCDKLHEVEKPMAECSKKEKCPKCGEVMQRVFEVHSIRTGDGIK